MTIEKQPFEDVSPIENGDFPASHISLPEGRRSFHVFHFSIVLLWVEISRLVLVVLKFHYFCKENFLLEFGAI